MNNSSIDVLLKLSVPRSGSSSATRPRDDSPAFGNHFRQANDAGRAPAPSTPPASAPAPQPTGSTSRDAENKSTEQQRPPSHAEPSRKPVNDAQSERASNSDSEAPVATAAVAADDTANEDHDDNKAEGDESAEVAAVLAAAEQLVNSAVPSATSTEEAPPADSADGDSAAKPPTDPSTNNDHSPTGKQSGQLPAVERNPEASPSPVAPDVEANAQPLAEAGATELDGALPPTEEAVESSEVAKDSAATRSKTDRSREHGSAHDAGANQLSDEEKPTTQKINQAVTVPTKSPKSPASDASTKDDKRSSARISATADKATPPPTERSLASARAADVPVSPPAAANTHSQVPAAAISTSVAPTDPAAGGKETSTSKPGPLSPFARLERGNQATRESHRAGQSEAVRHIDPARFVSRVARAIHTAQERGGPLQLRLSPPELGAMRLEIALNQGALTATIETDNQSARQLLLDNLPALRDRLAEQNVKIERFDVDVRRDSTGSQQQPTSHDRGGTNENPGHRSGGHNSARRESIPQPADEAAPIRRTITTTSINVVA